MELGYFSERGRLLVGKLGSTELGWDRHSGGRLQITRVSDRNTVPVGRLTIQAQSGNLSASSSSDPAPRLIPVEAGPHRIALRAVQRLFDSSQRHIGDAMQESWAWSNGDVHLNAMARLVRIDPAGDAPVFCAKIRFDQGWRSVGDPASDTIRLVHESGMHVAVTRYGDGSVWAAPVGDSDPWEGLNGRPPYYRRWGPYYDQWGGRAGWGGWELDTGGDTGPTLTARFCQAERAGPGAIAAVRATLALLFAECSELLDEKIEGFGQPGIPEADGGRVLYYAPMDGSVVVRKTSDPLTLTFPPGRPSVQARALVCGMRGRHVVRDVDNSTETAPFPLTDGGASDDPNGPDLLRPDDLHGLILTDEHTRPDEVIVVQDLSPHRETRVELSSTPGIQMACQRWDDRRNLLLFSSAHAQGSLLALSLHDLKARNLRIPGKPTPVMARLPLYWFQANAASAHHCLNVLDRFDLVENGPEQARFTVCSHNPARTARSEVDVGIPYLLDRLQLDLVCRFSALERWDLPEIQYCNFFPEETRDPDAWNPDRVLVMAGDGQWMRIDPRAETKAQVRAGERFSSYEGPLFVALYGGQAGNTFAFAQPGAIAGARGKYQLCGCWLDNHLSLSGPSETIPAGTEFEVSLTLTMAQTSSVDSDVQEMGRRALETGCLDLQV
jgi:hypothetical protein